MTRTQHEDCECFACRKRRVQQSYADELDNELTGDA